MCRMCEGFSLEDVMALDAARIAEHGYTLIGVEEPGAEDGPQPWAYTVGLLDAMNHPEIIIAGVSTELAASVLSMLAQSVLEGEVYAVGDTMHTGHGTARIGAVNPVQYELDTFNMWKNLVSNGTLFTNVLEAVQVIVPSSYYCSVHRHSQPLLSDPAARVGVRRSSPNRAERRRRQPRHRPRRG